MALYRGYETKICHSTARKIFPRQRAQLDFWIKTKIKDKWAVGSAG